MAGREADPTVGEAVTPRAKIRAALRTGPTAATGLFLPLAYTVAAQIEALEVHDFLLNPTKLAKGLQSLHTILRTDALVCACAGGMEAEAIGATLAWDAYPPKIVSHPAQHGALADDVAGLISKSARSSAALEATQRLNRTTEDWHSRVVTLSETKGLSERFFAALRMTRPRGRIVKCPNVVWSNLDQALAQ